MIHQISDWQACLGINNYWVELRTQLVERGRAFDDGRARGSDIDVSGAADASWQQIRYVKQQVQGALEWLDRGSEKGSRMLLRREMTNPLELRVRMRCKYCGTEEHRNGDCVLPGTGACLVLGGAGLLIGNRRSALQVLGICNRISKVSEILRNFSTILSSDHRDFFVFQLYARLLFTAGYVMTKNAVES